MAGDFNVTQLRKSSAVAPGWLLVPSTGGAFSVLKVNLSAVVDPSTTDDSGSGYSEGSLWVNAAANKVFFCADPAASAAVWAQVGSGGGVSGVVPLSYTADVLQSPVSADWAVNALAVAAADSNNSAIIVRRFDDTIEEGVGLTVPIPSGMTNIIIRLRSRAETAPGVAAAVRPKLYTRNIPDNAVVPAWSVGTLMTLINIPTNAYWQYDTETFSLATLGLIAGRTAQIELTRGGLSGDTLIGDWTLLELQLEFS